MVPALVVGCFVLVIAAGFILAANYTKKAAENFRRLAIQLGLIPVEPRKEFGFVWSQPSATGVIRNRTARLFSYSTGSGKTRTEWCAFSLNPHDSRGFTFQISAQGLASKIFQLFGSREILIGDSAFDSKWFIQTNQPEFLQAALLPELRERMTAALSGPRGVRSPTFKLEANTITYSEIGNFGNDLCCSRIAGLEEVMSDLAAVAEVFAQQSK